MVTFRCDDVSINTDMVKLLRMTNLVFEAFPEQVEFIWGVSPLVHDMSKADKLAKERIFPQIMNAHSDHRIFYKTNKAGIPPIDPRVKRAGHGIVHVDHRLLSKDVQELSILISTSLVKADMFIPPFNKWNKDTEAICQEHGIQLMKFEHGWKHMMYNDIRKQSDERYYFHTHDMTFEQFAEKINHAS